MKFVIFICDEPVEDLKLKHGDYYAMFKSVFEKTVQTFNLQNQIETLTFDSFDVRKKIYPTQVQDYDAVILTGSKHSAYEDSEWIHELKIQIRKIVQDKSSILIGICFGHQVIAEALGGKVEKNTRGWEVGWTEISLSNGLEDNEKKTIAIHQMHQDIVTKLPPGFHIQGQSAISKNQIMVLPNQCISIQGHPEYSSSFIQDLVAVRTAKGIFTSEFQQDILARNEKELDNLWFVKKVLDFCIGSKNKE